MSPQRELATSVAACLAGAALAIYGATRVWSVQVTERPGLTSLRTQATGAAQQPWLIGLALVALAGAGALLATRGLPRRLLGGLLTLVGAALVGAAITGRAGHDPGAAGAGATFWPIACGVAGALVAWGGLTAARHGHHWPAMGSRYERRPVPSLPAEPAATQAPSAAAGLTGSQAPASDSPPPQRPAAASAPEATQAGAARSIDTRAAWDALDRGDDPTTG